ncbi:MAG: response regulator [Deltaproteobacteria bacterium]|nr:response regulator [Deltaproteobacteria bacterium]
MKEKVLVVDDEWEIRDVLSNFLTEKGYEVILASNGEEAIELAEKENPHVILLDVKMPGIDGIETCRRFKEGEKTRYIPVIMITAFGDREIEAYLEGADDFIVKPFNMMEISFRIESMLRIRHLTDELERAMAYIERLRKKQPELRCRRN